MEVKPNPQNVDDYLKACVDGSVRINHDYQRGGGIWSKTAKSALIETVINHYPMPAIFLHNQFDSRERVAFKDIVDGQQRTETLREYVENEFALSKSVSPHLRGLKFRDLNVDEHRQFITYTLPIFHLEDATEEDVREAFRRINSYTASLNAEEKRHARYQSPFKWWVHSLSKVVQPTLISMKVISASQANRMKDMQLLADIVLTLEMGIVTTKAEALDSLYQRHENEDEYDLDDRIRDRILQGLRVVGAWEKLAGSALTKPYQFHTMWLAVMHALNPISTLSELKDGGDGISADAQLNLSRLLAALDDPDGVRAAAHAMENPDQPYEDVDLTLAEYLEFVNASSGSTNSAPGRKTRFEVLYEAIAC